MSRIGKIILSLCVIVAIERFCYFQTGGFRLAKVTSTQTYPFSSPVTEPPQSLYQPFHYLGKGVQCYVFIGKDRKTILKLFKHYHTGWPTGAQRRERRMIRMLKSCEIALKQLPQETGVFYAHLQKGDHHLGKIEIHDKLGIVHQLNLDQTEFLLQKRAIPLEEELDRLFSSNQVDAAIERMQSLLGLIEARAMKGIRNKDGRIFQNCGFIGEQPVEIDVGSYGYGHAKSSAKARAKLLKWVKENYPQYLKQCEERLQ